MSPVFAEARKAFHLELLRTTLVATKANQNKTAESDSEEEDFDLNALGIRKDGVEASTRTSAPRLVSNADSGNKTSISLAWKVASALGPITTVAKKPPGQRLGDNFEKAVFRFLQTTFPKLKHLRPGRWKMDQVTSRSGLGIASFQQYSHLSLLSDLAKQHKQLATVLGNEYLVAPDIIIARKPEDDPSINVTELLIDDHVATFSSLREKANQELILHASVSCKWTIRSDRSQNARSEALNLIRNRKGRNPHVIVVTAEPLPGRLASIALGTGDIDCVYHFALHELTRAVRELDLADSADTLQMLVDGRRLRDISDLPLDLAV
jgi:NgoMIV restriction enzyme